MESNGIGKLLPKAISGRRRKKLSAGDDAPRGRSTASRETTESDSTNSLTMADDDHDPSES